MDEIDEKVLLEIIVETIYVLTAQPLSEDKLKLYIAFYGQGLCLIDILHSLGCRSLNTLIRKYAERFEPFLEVYVTPDKKLFYFNKSFQKDSKLDDFKRKVIDGPHQRLAIADTIYFEKHNQEKYLRGRRELVKAVDECKKSSFLNNYGFIIVNELENHLRIANGGWRKMRGEWFPECAKTEKIFNEIAFEEIECTNVSNGRPQLSIRLIPGKTLEELVAQIERIKNGRIELDKKMVAAFQVSNSQRTYNPPNKRRSESKTPPNRLPNRAPQKIINVEDRSESESEDDRVENAPYTARMPLRKRNYNAQIEDQKPPPEVKKEERPPPPPAKNNEMGAAFKSGISEELGGSQKTSSNIIPEIICLKEATDTSRETLLNVRFEVPNAPEVPMFQPEIPLPPKIPAGTLYSEDEYEQEEESHKQTPPPCEPTPPVESREIPHQHRQQSEAASWVDGDNHERPPPPSDDNSTAAENESSAAPKRGFKYATNNGKFKPVKEMSKDAKSKHDLWRRACNGTDKSRSRPSKVSAPLINTPAPPNKEDVVPPLGNFSLRPVYLKTVSAAAATPTTTAAATTTTAAAQPAVSRPPPSTSSAQPVGVAPIPLRNVQPQIINPIRRTVDPLPTQSASFIRRDPPLRERTYSHANSVNADQPIARTFEQPPPAPIVHTPAPRYPQQRSPNRGGYQGNPHRPPAYHPPENYSELTWKDTPYGDVVPQQDNHQSSFYPREPEMHRQPDSYPRQLPRHENSPFEQYPQPGPSRLSSFRPVPSRQTPVNDGYYPEQRRPASSYNFDYGFSGQQNYIPPSTEQRPMSTFLTNHPPPGLGYRPASVAPTGKRSRVDGIYSNGIKKVIDEMCSNIRNSVEDQNGSISLEILQNTLRRVHLPTHPENIHDAHFSTYTWSRFVQEFLPDLILHTNETGVKFLMHPRFFEDDR